MQTVWKNRKMALGALLCLIVAVTSSSVGCDDKPAEQAGAQPEIAAEVEAQPEAAVEAEAEAVAQPEQAAAAVPQDNEPAGRGATPPDQKSGTSQVYGNRFTIIEEPVTLVQAIEKADAGAQGPFKIAATIDKVCQAKGCWMTLKGEEAQLPVRVKFKDYAFFVPKNVGGDAVVIEGTLTRRVVPQAEAQHYAEDEARGTGKPAARVEGDQEGWEMMATAVEVRKGEAS